jgi:hypothetical protein
MAHAGRCKNARGLIRVADHGHALGGRLVLENVDDRLVYLLYSYQIIGSRMSAIVLFGFDRAKWRCDSSAPLPRRG